MSGDFAPAGPRPGLLLLALVLAPSAGAQPAPAWLPVWRPPPVPARPAPARPAPRPLAPKPGVPAGGAPQLPALSAKSAGANTPAAASGMELPSCRERQVEFLQKPPPCFEITKVVLDEDSEDGPVLLHVRGALGEESLQGCTAGGVEFHALRPPEAFEGGGKWLVMAMGKATRDDLPEDESRDFPGDAEVVSMPDPGELPALPAGASEGPRPPLPAGGAPGGAAMAPGGAPAAPPLSGNVPNPIGLPPLGQLPELPACLGEQATQVKIPASPGGQ